MSLGIERHEGSVGPVLMVSVIVLGRGAFRGGQYLLRELRRDLELGSDFAKAPRQRALPVDNRVQRLPLEPARTIVPISSVSVVFSLSRPWIASLTLSSSSASR